MACGCRYRRHTVMSRLGGATTGLFLLALAPLLGAAAAISEGGKVTWDVVVAAWEFARGDW